MRSTGAAEIDATPHTAPLRCKPIDTVPLVANGTVDIERRSTVNTIARQSQVDFSAAHFISRTRLLVKSGSGIKDEDLDGKAIALPITSPNETPAPLSNGEYALLLAFLAAPQHT